MKPLISLTVRFDFCLLLMAIISLACFVSTASAQDASPLFPPPLPAQSTPVPNSTPVPTSTPVPEVEPAETGLISLPTVDDLQAKLKMVESDETLEPALKDQLLQTYRIAIESRQKIDTYKKRVIDNREAIPKVPEKAAVDQAEYKDLPEQYPLSVTKSSELSDIDQALTAAEAELRDWEAKKAQADQAQTQRTLDRKKFLELQVTQPERLKDLQSKLTSPPPAGQSPRLTQALSDLYNIQLQMLNEETAAVKEELTLYDAEKAVRRLATKFELWTKKVDLQRKKVETLQQLKTEKKLKENMDALKELKAESNTTLPVLQPYIDEIEAYTTRINELVDLNEEAQARNSQVKLLLDDVSTSEQKTEEQENTEAGKSEGFALSLLRQLYELPDIEEQRAEIQARKSVMSETTFEQIELGSKKKKLIDVDAAVNEQMEEIKKKIDDSELGIFEQSVKAKLREIIIRKKETLENLETTYTDLLDSLTVLDANQRSLVETVDDYRNYIRKRIFWIRSDKSLGIRDLASLFQRDSYPVTREDLVAVPTNYLRDMQKNKLIHGLGVAIFILLILLRVQAVRELSVLAEIARKNSASQIWPTLRAILLTAVIAAPIPMLLWFAGWRLSEVDTNNNFSNALAETLKRIGLIFGMIEFFRQVCRKNGLVDAHFNGPNVMSARIRHKMYEMIVILLPIFFVVTFLNELTTDLDRLPLERIFFAVGMILTGLFAHRLLNPRGSLMREVFLLKNSAPISKTRWIWYPLATAFPIVLAGMAWVGYYYTASQLGWRMAQTTIHICVILLIWGIALRWYRMFQRWFHIYVLRERMRIGTEESQPQTLEGQRVKLEQESRLIEDDRKKQTLRLINFVILIPFVVGLWNIWSDVLPAVAYLDEIQLWTTSVKKEVILADGTPSMQTATEAITPVNLIIAIIAAMLTFGLSRNLPGMIDFVVLQRVGFDASLRYAFTSVIGYIATFVGATYAFGMLGFRWEQIQWLAAALTFGLSFGLQEIFANFISGLIILFERPIRIGDIVTIEGVTGIVTRIRIRASTITDWDRKEYLVPNKELVTGRLLNWTLSDTLNRITIPVGVAYGSDTDRVRELLLEIAKENEHILNDPATLVNFEGFGDSTLNFVMRVYLGAMDKRLDTIHWLHSTIHRRFMHEGIEIAFPQRDLHIRSVPPNWNGSPANPSP